jgi:hypothetical protein
VKQLSALHSEHSLAKKGLQKRKDFWREREREKKIENVHCKKTESKTTDKYTDHHSQG